MLLCWKQRSAEDWHWNWGSIIRADIYTIFSTFSTMPSSTRNLPKFGRMFLCWNYIDINKNTYTKCICHFWRSTKSWNWVLQISKTLSKITLLIQECMWFIWTQGARCTSGSWFQHKEPAQKMVCSKGSKINVDGIKAVLGLKNHERFSSQCIILNL